jgi:hypothetical protein
MNQFQTCLTYFYYSKVFQFLYSTYHQLNGGGDVFHDKALESFESILLCTMLKVVTIKIKI